MFDCENLWFIMALLFAAGFSAGIAVGRDF